MPTKEETSQQQIAAAQANADNKVARAEKAFTEINEKFIAQGKHLDAARAENNELLARVETLTKELDSANARVAVEHGAAFEVELVRTAPFNGKSLPVGTVIGTITPLKGETTDYVVDAVRGGFAKCVACKGKKKKKKNKNEGGGEQS